MSERVKGGDKGRDPQAREDASHPLVMAFEAGALLNRLDWHVQQAWLLPVLNMAEARHHSRAVVKTLTDLASRADGVARVGTTTRVSDVILQSRDEWWRLFGSL